MSTRKDQFLIKEFSLPPAAGSVQSDAFDIYNEKTPNDIHDIHAQFQVLVPALTTTHLPASTSLAVKIQSSDDETFASGVDETTVATISGGAAYSGGVFAFKASEKPLRYWRARITATGTIGSMAAVKGEFAIVF